MFRLSYYVCHNDSFIHFYLICSIRSLWRIYGFFPHFSLAGVTSNLSLVCVTITVVFVGMHRLLLKHFIYNEKQQAQVTECTNKCENWLLDLLVTAGTMYLLSRVTNYLCYFLPSFIWSLQYLYVHLLGIHRVWVHQTINGNNCR